MSHGIAQERWQEIALAFKVGGYVTAYECDAYLRLTRGQTKRAVLDGRLAARQQPRGTKIRYVVSAADAEAVLGQRVVVAPADSRGSA